MLEKVLEIILEHALIAEIVLEIIQNKKKGIFIPFFHEDELYNPLLIFR